MTVACALDASAILALLQMEPGHEIVLARIERGQCMVSAVNLTEVLTRLIDRGMSADDAEMAVDALELDVVAFDNGAARACARLRAATRHLGLSIGDRACLALAEHRAAVALTADHAWSKVTTGVKVEFVRKAKS